MNQKTPFRMITHTVAVNEAIFTQRQPELSKAKIMPLLRHLCQNGRESTLNPCLAGYTLASLFPGYQKGLHWKPQVPRSQPTSHTPWMSR